jgi:dihydroorotate dehydrogenase
MALLLDPLWKLTRPLLFQMDAERAHRAVLGAMGSAPRLASMLLGTLTERPPASLNSTIGGLSIGGPVGLAAGLDKDGEAVPVWEALGFGFIEVGTVTAHPQPGNPTPRLFRLVDEQAIINRMGFNNHGSQALADRLRALREKGRWPKVPVGANVGKSKMTPLDEAEDDYLTSVMRLREVVDWFTVNVSSPNTPGLRALQEPERLARLLGRIIPAAGGRPVWLKLAPDLEPSALEQAVEVAIQSGVAGLVATNTTNSRPGNTAQAGQDGGLSGAPLWPLARERIQQVVSATQRRVPVVGVGGISSTQQVEELMAMGCAAVQVYTAFLYVGPGLPAQIHRDLARAARSAAQPA